MTAEALLPSFYVMMGDLLSSELGFSMGHVRVGSGHTILVTVNTVTVRGMVSHHTPQTCGVVMVSTVLSRHSSSFLGKFEKKAVTCC